MRISLDIANEYKVPHSRVIALIEELSTLSEFQGVKERYDHIIEHNKRPIKAWRMDERFYTAVILHLPTNKRIAFTSGLINRLFEEVPTNPLPVINEPITAFEILTLSLKKAGTVTNLAEHIGLSQGLVSQWKSTKTPISSKGMDKLKAYLEGTL
jgi:hypothetical protein